MKNFKKHKNKVAILVVILIILCVIILFIDRYIPVGNSFPNLPRVEQTVTTTEDYLADFDYAYEVLKETYPYFEVNKIKSGVDWLANRDKYRAEIAKSKSASDFYNKMNLILEDLHNGHTNIVQEQYGIDNYIIYKRNSPKASWRADIARQYENPKARARYMINNDTIEKYLALENKKTAEGNSKNISVGDIKEDIAYIKVSVMGQDYEVEEDKKIVLPYLEKIKDYKALVIDIRGNGGGNTNYYEKFLYPYIASKPYSVKAYDFIKSDRNKKLIKQMYMKKLSEDDIKSFGFPERTNEIIRDFNFYTWYGQEVKPNNDSIRFKGKIYLLVNRGVYSAAEAMASFSKESGFATLIGERTGGDGIGFDPMQVLLPNTGYVMKYSYDLGTTESGSVNELEQTTPDIVCDPSTSGALIDQPCIQEVLRLEE